MAAPTLKRITAEEYLEAERKAEFRSEFWLGYVYAMAGGTANHSEICSNLSRFLQNRLDGRPCKIYGSDMKVGVTKKRGFSYPDITVASSERQFYDKVCDVLMNPTAIFEVLSDSTRALDLGRKFEEYRKLESLRHYVLVEPNRRLVTHYKLSESGQWILDPLTAENDVVKLLDIELPLTEIYHQVELDPEPDIE